MTLIRALTLLLICLMSLSLQTQSETLSVVSEAVAMDGEIVDCAFSHHDAVDGCEMADCSATATCCASVSAAVIVQSYTGIGRSGLAGPNEPRIFYRSADRAPVFHPPRHLHLS